MNFSFAFLITFAACVYGAPSDTEITPVTDEKTMKYVNEMFDSLANPSGPKEELMKDILDGIDRKCIFNQYKKYNFEDQVFSKENERMKNSEVSKIAVIIFATQCDTSVDALLEYFFENFMTFRILYKAFADEPEIKDYIDRVRCLSAYAVNHKIVDTTTYTFKTEVDNSERCEAEKQMIRGLADEFISDTITQLEAGDSQDCLQKSMTTAENYILRNALLIQIDLTDEQKVTERQNFVKDMHKLLEDVIHCFVAQTNEISKNE